MAKVIASITTPVDGHVAARTTAAQRPREAASGTLIEYRVKR